MYIYAWNTASEGAKNLKDALGIKRIKHENSKFKGRPNKIVINWGSSTVPDEVIKCKILNPPEKILLCSDKLRFFKYISRVNPDIIPPWTESFDEAVNWVRQGTLVCARTVLNGHSANGLIIMTRDDPETFVRAPLYTMYIKKQEEYRIHIVNNNIVDFQRKTLKREKAESGEEINWHVRNLENGFIYQRENVVLPDCAKRVATDAMRIIGLDFGAVDVIYNKLQNRAYVLEINTAPGLQGSTVQSYEKAFRGFKNV